MSLKRRKSISMSDFAYFVARRHDGKFVVLGSDGKLLTEGFETYSAADAWARDNVKDHP
jgi:hypothetical protein